jgi:hypothetical protein
MPTSTENSIAARASSIVAGNRCLISSETGLRDVMLVPKSNLTTVPRYAKYCSCTGRSRP